MDFVNYIRAQSAKLKSRQYVLILWNELEDSPSETEASAAAMQDFDNHLPVLLDQFWETVLEKLNSNDEVGEIDSDLQQYLLVLLYHCTTQTQDFGTHACIMHASEVYIHLLNVVVDKKFYKSKLYQSALTTLKSSIQEGSCQESTRRMLQKLKGFLPKSDLSKEDLEFTLAILMHIIFATCTKVHEPSFDINLIPESVSLNALLSMKTLILNEKRPNHKSLITLFFFTGLRKISTIPLTPHILTIIQTNLRNLLKSCDDLFKEDDYKTFMNSFIHIWMQPDFTYFGEAVLIMNGLREKHYRVLLEVLHKTIRSKPYKNLFRFSLAIACNPPHHMPIEKIFVTNEIVLKGIIMNTIADKPEISNASVEATSVLLLSPNLQKECILVPIKNIIKHCDKNVFKIPTLFRGLKTLMTKKWSAKCKNKQLFGIIVSLMLISERDYPDIYQEVLELLSEDASPHDLKPFLPLLSEVYLKFTQEKCACSALQIFKVLFKMALNPMATSSEFVKYLYTSMTQPISYKGVTMGNGECFINLIISNDFNYTEYIEKCHSLGLIKKDHVTKLLGNLQEADVSNLRLCCAIVHHTDFSDLSLIANYVKSNFKTLCNEPKLDYFLYIYDKILKNNPKRTKEYLRCNEIMTSFLKKHLLEQNLRWDTIANAFSLLKSLSDFTVLEEDFFNLQQEYDRKLMATLQHQKSFVPIYYFSQLVLFGNTLPNDDNMKLIKGFLTMCSKERYTKSKDFNPKIWIGCLMLFTNICIVKNSNVEEGTEFLQNALESPVMAVRLSAVNMTFDLSNMVTHNFEDLIRFMFRELVLGDNVFKRTCLVKIDRLIRDDYLKLELEQFMIFVCILGDKSFGLGDYLNQLLNQSFFTTNTPVIAKYFVPLLVHVNGFMYHPVYKISKSCSKAVQIMVRKISDRRKVFDILFNPLPVKLRFNIIYTVSVNILEKVMNNILTCDNGYWTMIKDSIRLFKMASSNSHEGDSYQAFYKKIMSQISKYILQKTEYSENRQYPQHQKEIVYSTTILLKFFFYNTKGNVDKLIFEALMHWTEFLLADLIHIVHVERVLEIQAYYLKIDKFYKKNAFILTKPVEENYVKKPKVDDNQISGIVPAFNINNTDHPNLGE